ncbi:hypothetical protein PoB_000754000 [Plakobranchus ocellatus]|uniref:Uncharacterized protein n=1 Tax=Plakobranchus ocellatus TaxID=259542 RepID=A0AAV3YDB8_9GAST|nr:hypothetical protein PoB_000754000 [Plakobranchus ocellatus]
MLSVNGLGPPPEVLLIVNGLDLPGVLLSVNCFDPPEILCYSEQLGVKCWAERSLDESPKELLTLSSMHGMPSLLKPSIKD